jgi:hypothetical protein
MELADAPNEESGEEENEESSTGETLRYFNPMNNYFTLIAGIVVSYVLFFIFGYPVLIITMLFFVVQIVKETVDLLGRISRGFLRKAAYLNVSLTLFYFGILAINGLAIFRGSPPPILPQIGNLTFLTPLLMMTAMYGLRNIRGMVEAREDTEE